MTVTFFITWDSVLLVTKVRTGKVQCLNEELLSIHSQKEEKMPENVL